MEEEKIIALCLLIIPSSVFIIWLILSNRCPYGGQHKWNKTYDRYVRGVDIGFGIDNSFNHITYKCKKCGEESKSFE